VEIANPTSVTDEVGSPPSSGTIPLSVPHLQGNEWAYVKECLDTNWVSSGGPFVTRFERELADYVGSDYGVATASGTAALHVALLVAGVEPDDEVLVSTLTFIAPANAVRYVGAWPVFIDAEPDYWQMDPVLLADFLDTKCLWREGRLINKTSGRTVKAILPVHILGHPCDMDPILEIAHKYELVVVEDATESLGARYKGRMVGHLGDVGCFSFNGNKIITTGGGGMVVTDNEAWARRAQYLTTQAKNDPVEYVHDEIGYNYRLTNVQAALGCAQLENIDQALGAKRRIAGRYLRGLQDIPGLVAMRQAPWAESIFWMFTALVDQQTYGLDSRSLLQALEQNSIQTRPLWQPIHLSPAHSGCEAWGGGVAEGLHRDALSLPCSVGLSPDVQDRVIDALSSLHSERRAVPPPLGLTLSQ